MSPDLAPEPVPVVVLIPTTPERRDRLRQCLDSLTRCAGHPHIVMTYENQYVGAIAAIHTMLDRLDPDTLVWWIGDDNVLKQPGTLRALVDAFHAAFPDRDGVVVPDDGVQRGRIATMPMCTAGVLKAGQSKAFFHNFADELFTDRMRARGKYVYLPEVQVDHLHWCMGTAARDYTYDNAQARFEQDRATYERLRGT